MATAAEKNIPPDLAKPILQIARNDPSLTHLFFQRLKLGIHQIIAKNRGITNLDISFNYFTPCCITNITPFMRTNMNIIKIHIEEYSARGTIDMVKWVSCPHIALVRRNIVEASEQNKRLFLCRNNSTDTASFEKRKFVEVPPMIYTAYGLRELSLAENYLQELSSSLYQLTNLRKLDLSNNRIHNIEVNQLTLLSNLTELNLENNLLSSIPFRLATLSLNNLKLNNNLLVSNLSYPHYLLENNGVHVHLHPKNSRLAPQDSIIASRVFFLGDRQSDIFKIVPLLKGIQIVHDSFKFLTNVEREILNTAANPASRSMDVTISDWFPVTEMEMKREEDGERFLGIFKSTHRGSEDDVSGRSRFSSRIHSMTRALSRDAEMDLKPRDVRSRSLLLHPDGSSDPQPSGRLSPVHPRSPRDHNPGLLLVPSAPQEAEHKGPGSRVLTSQKSSRFTARKAEIGISFRHVSCWVLDSVCLHAHQLLTAGPANKVPIVIAFKLTLDVDQMSGHLVRLIRSFRNLQPLDSSPQASLFIVGTYKKSFDKMNRTSKKVRKQLEKVFPSLIFTFLLVCTSTGHHIKHLSEKIVEALDKNISNQTLPYPFLAADCTPDWYYYFENQICTFVEAIRCIKEELDEIDCERTKLARSVLHWDEFTSLAQRYQIPNHECGKLANFLRHLGVVHHYRDLMPPKPNEEGSSNSVAQLIFLKPSVIFKAYSMILRSFSMVQQPYQDCEAILVVPEAGLDLVWSIFARELHESLLSILEVAGQILRLKSGNVLVPEMFNPLPSALSGLDQPPEWKNQDRPDFYIARTYSFKEMSDSGFCRLVVGVHEIVRNFTPPQGRLVLTQVYMYCVELVLYDKPSSPVSSADPPVIGRCRITYDHLRSCSSLFVCEDDTRRPLFCLISEQLIQLFRSDKAFFPLAEAPVHAMCVCVNCRASESPLAPDAWIPMDWIEDIAAEGNAFYYCGELALRIDLVAPDISLTNLKHLMVNYEDLNIQHRVGSGSFATVHYGTYQGKEIAIKQLNKSASTSETLAEFRHEVSLMAGLQHPNTVGLQGLCTQPFCVITEFCPYGDLYSYLESRRKRELPLPIEYTMKCLADIAKGMQFLHSATPPILHRDLKSPNILVCEIAPDEETLPEENRFPTPKFLSADREPSPVAVKVADFGLSMKTTGPLTERVVDNPIWLAPELLAKQPYSSASDVYAFGIIANEMFSLMLPFEDTEYTYLWQLEKKIVEGTRPTIPDHVPMAMRNLIQKCWQEDTQKRPSFTIIAKRIEALIEERQKGPTMRATPAASDMKVETEKRKRRYSIARKISDGLLTEEELRLLLLKNEPHSELDAEAVELTPEELAALDALDHTQASRTQEEKGEEGTRLQVGREITDSVTERPKKPRTKQKRKIASSRLHPAALKKKRTPE